MADLKISALPASTTPLAGTEILPIVQSATTRQVSVANLTAGRAVSALSLTSTNDATINGVTVGRGGGSVSLNTAVGASALAATSTGDGNAAFGASALASNLAGTGNTATGFTSLRDNTSGNYNVASGYLALATNLSGANNVGIGYSVLSTGTATSNNTAIGYEALKVTSGSTNTAIGYQSGIAMTTGTKNVILGSYSGNTGTLDIRISNNNIVLSDGDGNVRAWWDNANARFYGTLLATGITNSALTSGRVTYAGTSGVLQDSANLLYAGGDLTVYGLNVGRGSGAVATNTALGNAALNANTTGSNHVAIGYRALSSMQTGTTSVAVGQDALKVSVAGTNNTAVGFQSMLSTLTAADNSAFGVNSLALNTTGANNTALGAYSLQSNTSASNNTAVGYQAGYTNSTGAKNVFIGQQAGKVSTGNFNTIIGNEAGLSLTTGTCNTFVGGYNNTVGGSGELVTSGSKNTILGVFTGNQGGLDIRTASNYIVLSDGDGNPRQIIDSSGNLGLGVTPSAWSVGKAIEVGNVGNAFWGVSATQISITQNAFFDGAWKYAANGYATRFQEDSGAYIWNTSPNNTSGAGAGITFTQAMTLNASGNLGIGTSSPDTKLHVYATSNALTKTEAGTSAASAVYQLKTPDGEQAIYSNNNALIFSRTSSFTESMRITSAGNVGIGTNSPSALLGIATSTMNSQILLGVSTSNSAYGSISLNGSSADNGRLGFTGGGTGDNTLYIDVPTSGGYGFRLGGTNVMTINSSGIVTMGAYGAGAATFSAAGVISSVSDETWKTKDGVPTNPDAMLQKLEPGYWFYNDEKKETFGEDRQLGFYAQNVHEAIGSEAAPTPEEGKPWGYYDRSVLAVTVMSLKNALNTIEELKQRIEILENK